MGAITGLRVSWPNLGGIIQSTGYAQGLYFLLASLSCEKKKRNRDIMRKMRVDTRRVSRFMRLYWSFELFGS